MKTLLIDNHDSFTFNLYHLLSEVNGTAPIVLKNDELPWAEVSRLSFDNILISPGPGRPDRARDFGISREAILHSGKPVLGVCLGHQGIGQIFGADLRPAPEILHGRPSLIRHEGRDLFEGIPSPFTAIRYHSWVLGTPLPETLEALAWTDAGVLMALRHRELPLWGVQFHPESICTEHGRGILENFRELSGRSTARSSLAPAEPNRAPMAVAAPRRPSGPSWKIRWKQVSPAPDAEALFNTLYRNSPTSFWLDSSRVIPDLSRFSFLGDFSGPRSMILSYRKGDADFWETLKSELTRRRAHAPDLPFEFNCGFVGYLGYGLNTARASQSAPDAWMGLADRLIALDHLENKLYLVEAGPENSDFGDWIARTERRIAEIPSGQTLGDPFQEIPPEAGTPPRLETGMARSRYLEAIETCLDAIRNGESYEICLTYPILAPDSNETDPWLVYRLLRRLNPAPYGAFLRTPDAVILCSSPERFLKATADGRLEAKPIKGTLPRGTTEEEDRTLRHRLASDEKFRSENLMITDLLRHDLGSVAQVGTVRVPKLMNVESYATVHQLVSTIEARLQEGLTPVDAVRAAFPGGSMTGAPKRRTLELIDQIEDSPRGIYSGALGFFGLNGSVDLNIVIRTWVRDSAGWSLGTGGAIVALSDPAEELEETLLKARAPCAALSLASRGRRDFDLRLR